MIEIDQNAEKVFTGDMSTMLCRYNPHLFSNINETQIILLLLLSLSLALLVGILHMKKVLCII